MCWSPIDSFQTVTMVVGDRDHRNRVGAGRVDSCRLATVDWGPHRVEPQRALCNRARRHAVPWDRSSELRLLRRVFPATAALVFPA